MKLYLNKEFGGEGMKKLISLIATVVLIMILGSACSNQVQMAPTKDYESFNEVMENYWLALAEKDFYTMRGLSP